MVQIAFQYAVVAAVLFWVRQQGWELAFTIIFLVFGAKFAFLDLPSLVGYIRLGGGTRAVAAVQEMSEEERAKHADASSKIATNIVFLVAGVVAAIYFMTDWI